MGCMGRTLGAGSHAVESASVGQEAGSAAALQFFAGIAAEILVITVFVWSPPLQPYFFTHNLSGPIWASSLVFGAFILGATELIKKQVREHPQGWVAKNLAW